MMGGMYTHFEYIYPQVGNRMSPKEWIEQGSTDVREKARAKVQATLAKHYPRHIADALDDEIRKRFNICIPRPDMRPGNGRW